MLTDPYQQYKQTQVGTASPARLLLMLYNAALKFARLAAEEVEKKNTEKANLYLGKTQDIVAELMISLDFNQGEIAENLYSLYRYINERLVHANIKKDVSAIREVEAMLRDLRDTWKTIANVS